jgi:hypothetical protein
VGLNLEICDYGCGQEAKYQFKNGKWCCSEKWQSCSAHKERVKKQTTGKNNPMYRRKQTPEAKEKIRLKALGRIPHNKNCPRSERVKEILRKKLKGREPRNKGKVDIYSEETLEVMRNRVVSEETRKLLSRASKFTIEKIKEKYPTFYKEEEMRYNLDKPDEKEIQVHCKNHNCKNSKEKGGWFTPTGSQIYERIRQLEKDYGNGGCYLYCSQHCKDTCILYNIHGDPYRDNILPYTSTELKTFNKYILKRDNEICYYCNKHHATIVHHRRPQKLEPFFALDPDYAISVCAKCHYKYGHPTGSEYSTGNLAKIVCSVESQKFLNQTLENI